jgi:hypothetical protein
MHWSNGICDKYYVNYTVRYDSSVIQPLVRCQSGPYEDAEEAYKNEKDIGGYAAVEDCYVTTVFDPTRLNAAQENGND